MNIELWRLQLLVVAATTHSCGSDIYSKHLDKYRITEAEMEKHRVLLD